MRLQLFMLLTAAITIVRSGRRKRLLVNRMHVDDGVSLINCALLVGHRHIGDVFLTDADLLYDMRRKESRSVCATHIAFQQTAISRTNHFDNIAGLYVQVTRCVARV